MLSSCKKPGRITQRKLLKNRNYFNQLIMNPDMLLWREKKWGRKGNLIALSL